MKSTISRLCNLTLLGAALMVPFAAAPFHLQAADQKYHDEAHHDDHTWNSHEDRAYRMWLKENHHKYVAFSKAREEDRQSYWDWRHNHSDAELKIKIH